MIRVLLVDDHELVRSGLAALLSMLGDVDVAGQARDGVEALDAAERLRPDVVLLDVRLPRLDGIGVLRALRREPSPPAVVMLTTFDDDRVLREALACGASGWLLKDASLEQLGEALRAAVRGERYVQPGSRRRLLEGLERLEERPFEARAAGDLTDREVEVLRFLARGFSNAEVAETLGVAEGTVKNHVSNILSKLGVRDRTRAVLAALDLGLV